MADGQVLGDQQQESLGWRAGLPAEIREHEAVKSYKTVGDFAKAHIETLPKLGELEGKLKNSIPKLGENATPEEREQFYTSLGRPAKPEEYKFVEEDKSAPEWNTFWKTEMHKIGLPASQATALSELNHKMWNAVVQENNAKVAQADLEAETTLKTELGDKYPARIELANRLWKKVNSKGLNDSFKGENSASRVEIIRYILDVAAKTGEDMSSLGSQSKPNGKQGGPFDFSKSPAPPPRRV